MTNPAAHQSTESDRLGESRIDLSDPLDPCDASDSPTPSSHSTWSTATVAEPISLDPATVTFAIVEGRPTILSLDPARDFELNTNIVASLRLTLQNLSGDIIAHLDYPAGLAALTPYVLDAQNGSILLAPLSIDEMHRLAAQIQNAGN